MALSWRGELGKRRALRGRKWYDVCPIDDDDFILLHPLAQWIADFSDLWASISYFFLVVFWNPFGRTSFLTYFELFHSFLFSGKTMTPPGERESSSFFLPRQIEAISELKRASIVHSSTWVKVVSIQLLLHFGWPDYRVSRKKERRQLRAKVFSFVIDAFLSLLPLLACKSTAEQHRAQITSWYQTQNSSWLIKINCVQNTLFFLGGGKNGRSASVY